MISIAGTPSPSVFLHILRGSSAASNLALLLSLPIHWWCRRRARRRQGQKPATSTGTDAGPFDFYRPALFAALLQGAFDMVFFFLSRLESSGWFPDRARLLLLLDLAARALASCLIASYLHFHVYRSLETRAFPNFLRIWWTLCAVLSASLLVLHLFLRCTDPASSDVTVSLLVLYTGSFILAAFLAVCGFAAKRRAAAEFDGDDKRDTAGGDLTEPLLNDSGDATAAGAASHKKSSGSSSLFSGAGFLSVLTFYWMGPLLSAGYRKTLDLDDVPDLDEADSIHGIYPTFKAKLEHYSSTNPPPAQADASGGDPRVVVVDGDKNSNRSVTTLALVKALFFTTWAEILLTGIYALVYTFASYVGPYLIDYFVQYLNGHQDFKNEGYVLVSAFVVSKLLECLSQRHWFFRLQQVGVRARAALVAIIYQKGLTLSGHSRQGHTTGEIINLMSVDADRIGLFSWYMHDLWMVPVQVILALLILYTNLGGLASVAAFVATVFVMLANYPLGKMQERYQENLMKAKDTRMKSTSEVLRNMRILKLQAWEMKFLDRIMELRNKETHWLKKYVYTSAMVTFVYWGAPTFVSVVTFGTCMLMGITLQSGKVLAALATFRVLQEPIYNLPDTISMVIQTKVSLERISTFLRLDDLQTDVVEKLPGSVSNVAVEFCDDASFSWDPSSATPTLKDLNFQVRHGMRVAVCGTVGSGKSSLLSCILGELHKLSGTVRLCGTTAYVAQSPWIQSGKIEDNILFGKEMVRDRYERVLEACSLKKDLEILPFGDQTVIGERGINLSGGQKQRIQIARALYQDADIFLFDDPFSAVDAHTGTHLFKECLLNLLASKTVIFVTHQIEFLPSSDLILVMKQGRITEAGKYRDILNSGTDFRELVGAHEEALIALDSAKLGTQNSSHVVEGACDKESSNLRFVQNEETKQSNNQTESAGELSGQSGQLVQEEEREKGKVGSAVYWKYITTSYKGALVVPILLSHILFQVLQIGSNYWMAWAAPVSEDMAPPVSALLLIYVYIALAVGSSVCVLVRALLLVTAGYKTATLLFNKMHLSVFRAPMLFFDSTPTGRILNRASTDQNEVDTSMAYQIGSFAFSIIQLFGIIVVMSQVAWQVFAIFVPVIAACIWYQNYYIATARELARLIGVCKAPIIQHFSESISGSTTIRSFNQDERFVHKSFHLSDAYSRPKFHNAAAMEWLCFRLDVLSSMTFAFSLIFLTVMPKGTIDPGIAGLAVTYGLNLNTLQSWVIWNLCNLENKIISVERILQYTSIPSEPPLTIEANKPGANWPVQGEVYISDLKVRYAPHMPYVLQGLTCTFHAGAKTGIVGRTGSGKSTLIQTLFRIVEPTIGQIKIDGTNILTIGLHDLRSRLSIIPQDPTMFEGSIRSNLDPLEEYSDEKIWEALDKCQLGDEVRRKEAKLDSAVTENGENWSVGQRQLVCLGRVLLKKSKVLVLDEATASVDTSTDNLIQKTLREQFSDSTVITIAHRITSVLDSDMVLLLDNGKIAEYDSPSKLLEERSSLFANLVAEYTLRLNSNIRNC